MNPSISIIATVKNEVDSISNFIESLLSQSLQANEIIIVDGKSQDGTNQILRDYETSSKIKLITQNCNIAQGRNIAIKSTSSEIIAVTDAGCHPSPNWLYEITKPLIHNFDIHAVSGKIIPESDTNIEHYCGFLSIPNHTSKQQELLFYGRCCAFRRHLWESLNGYPEWLYTAEDTLFALSASKKGFNVVHNENAIIYWRPRNNLKKIAKMFFLYGRGNGRINWGSIKGSLYWLRNHFLLLILLLCTFAYPIFLIPFFSFAYYLYLQIAKPSLIKVRKLDPSWKTEAFVPLITFIRNLASNLGFAYGYYEFKTNPSFKNNLENYLKRD